MGTKRIARDLDSAMVSRRLVRLSRKRGWDDIGGIVVGVGPEWVLISIEVDAGFDGFSAVRIRDIRTVTRMRSSSFVKKALALERHWPMPVPDDVDMSTSQGLVETIASQFPLLTIAYEGQHPDEVLVGAAVEIRRQSFRLLEITPKAKWGSRQNRWPYKVITRMEFGGPYANRLYAVGGRHPALERVDSPLRRA